MTSWSPTAGRRIVSPRQLIVLGVALLAALAALLLIRGAGGRAAPTSPATEAARPMGPMALVMTHDIQQGAALTAGDLEWRAFPQNAIGQHFIQQSQQPDALTRFTGAVTRRTFTAGEPVIDGEVVLPDGRGLFAAQLRPGYRAVATPLDSHSAVGGYIQPNDRVDVILTNKVDVERVGGRQGQETRSTVVLENVRVLALDEHTQPQAQGAEAERIQAQVAVLELTQGDAEILARADSLGDISLALRGVEAEPEGLRPPSARSRQAGALDQNVQAGGVRIHGFGSTQGGSQ